MLVVKLLGESTQVNSGSGSSVPNIDGLGAQYVMVQHSHSSDRVVEVRTAQVSQQEVFTSLVKILSLSKKKELIWFIPLHRTYTQHLSSIRDSIKLY